MVDVTEDQNTAEQVYQSFREVADGKPYITELDLRHSLVPDEVIDHITKICPRHPDGEASENPEMWQYDYVTFMDSLLNDPKEKPQPPAALGELPNGRVPTRDQNSPGKTNGYH